MKKLRLFALSLILISFVSCDPIEYDIFGTVEGRVLDYSANMPLENVSVQLSPGGKNFTTSSDGRFLFEELESKQYSVTVQKNGYETNMKTVNVVASETSEITITMKKKDYN